MCVPIHVLIVGHNLDAVESAKQVLVSSSRLQIHVSRPQAAIEALAAGTMPAVDIVLVDIDSPDPNVSLPAIAQVDAWRTRVPYLPLVALTRCEDEALALDAIRAGAHDCLCLQHLDVSKAVRIFQAAIARHDYWLASAPPPDASGKNPAGGRGGTQSRKLWDSPEADIDFPATQVFPDSIQSAESPPQASVQPQATAQQPTEEALRASEARLRAIFESEPECVMVVSLDGRLLDINPAGLRLIEAGSSDLVLDTPICTLIHPEDQETFLDLHQCATRGESGQRQFRLIGLNGRQRWMETHATPLRAATGAITSVLSVTRDITVQRWTEKVMLRIAQIVSRPIDENFYEQLLRDAVAALSAAGGLIALLDPSEPNVVHTQTFLFKDERQDNLSYNLAKTPCLPVLEQGGFAIGRDLQQHFPEDEMIIQYDLESYAGAPLLSQQGQVLGVLAVFRDRVMLQPELMLSAARILAARVAAEMERQTAEMARIASQRQTQLILAAVAEGILGLDTQGAIIFENPATLALLGWDEGEMIGQTAYPFIYRQGGDGYTHRIEECPIYQTLHDGRVRRETDDLFMHKDGNKFPVEYVCSPILDQAGIIRGVVVSFTDITERKRNELLLATEKDVLELISARYALPRVLEKIVLGIEALCPDSMASVVLVDNAHQCLRHGTAPHLPEAFNRAVDGIVIGPNTGSCGTAAYLGEQVIVTDIQNDPRWADYRALAREYELSACWSTPIHAPDGAVIATFAVYYRTPRAPRPGELDNIAHMVHLTGIAIVGDREEKALQASEERFRGAFQAAATGMAVTSLDNRFLQVNAAYCEMLGYREDELMAMDFLAITHPDDQAQSLKLAEELRAGKRSSYTYEKRYLTKQGTTVWSRVSIAGLHDVDGQLVGQIVVAEDITRRKQAEAALEHNQGLLRVASRLARLGGWAVELPELTLTWTDETRAIHEVPPDYVPTIEDAANFYAPHCRETIRAAVESCCREGVPFELELELITAQGRHLWVRSNGEAVRDEQGRIVRVQGAFQDVTAGKAAEEALLESEERFRLVTHATNDAVWDWDVSTGRVWWNENFETLFGYKMSEVEPYLEFWKSHLHPEDRGWVMETVDSTLYSEETIWQREYRFMRQDGSVAHVLDRGFVIRDEAGKAIRMVGGMSDLTERKKLEEQILRSQRMESLGVLAGGIAHDLNNVLTPIMLSTFLLKKNIHEPDARRQLDILEETATRGAEMVRQVLAFARGVEGSQIALEVKRIAQEVSKFMQETLGRDIVIELTAPEKPWTIIGDPTQIHQVLVNLCVNARDAMLTGGKIQIHIDNFYLDAQYAAMVPEAESGPYVRLTVADTGTGIPHEIMERIFDPFFTTKEPGQGTGLGLSTVQGIVKGHGGFITVYSEEGQGATFKVYLPAQEEVQRDAASYFSQELPRGEGELILVVDDEESLRLMTQQTLESFGYRTVLAEDGAEAIAIYVRRRNEIALVFTDMMMPVMDGYATIQALRKIDPTVPIVAASGLATTGMAGKVARAGVEHFLAKPYTADSILAILAAALGKER